MAKAINAGVKVVGVAQTNRGQLHGFLWTSSGGMLDLRTLGGKNSEAASARGTIWWGEAPCTVN
ncbi:MULTISPECIES: hypothetical protein [Cupriavidus]|uniref:hypothetical protein n=1 Tax=Cupriavidus sp. DF5525 TaxID=3160989 RepID=UPI00345F6160